MQLYEFFKKSYIPFMTKKYSILTGPLLLAVLGIAFCVWTALGNEVNICVTTGCNLYQDFTIGNISLWWYGTSAFTLLAALALLGQAQLGRICSGFFLFCDACLLLLMALTAPCVSCLIVALIFALSYFCFQRKNMARQSLAAGQHLRGFSVLLSVWIILFIVNLGQVAKSQFDTWPILDESGEATTKMFFSPSCHYCIEGINALSGNINVAFYPVAESDADIARIDRIIFLLSEGQNLAEAVNMASNAEFNGFWQQLNPAILLLRFRLLCNKAHLFAQGSQGVPFFEYKGLPTSLLPKPGVSAPVPLTGNAELPGELTDGGQCAGINPCPPVDMSPGNPR